MSAKLPPSSPFGQRLLDLRRQRGLTQVQLAEALGSTQRAISYYETVADYPPAEVIVQLARVLEVSTDVLLGVKTPKAPKVTVPHDDPETRRLWKRFQRVLELPEKDRRAVIRLVNSLVAAQPARRSAARSSAARSTSSRRNGASSGG
ncbi:MAG: helix-turn-helix transcriptional regulator [Polyangiaceae bacterium]|nr:helix-turn-helix transcriptional regulator [Polyangiaceae bacterium]